MRHKFSLEMWCSHAIKYSEYIYTHIQYAFVTGQEHEHVRNVELV